MNNITSSLVISALCLNAASAHTIKTNDYVKYCIESGGKVEQMSAEISTQSGLIRGQMKTFCNFYLHDAFISIGLETFSAVKPTIAATFMKKMGEIGPSSPLWKGKYANPSLNVCKNIGGATIGFVANGGFSNPLGQSDICVFGDGSMVSAWSLIYMANHREGYDRIKARVKASPLDIKIPTRLTVY